MMNTAKAPWRKGGLVCLVSLTATIAFLSLVPRAFADQVLCEVGATAGSCSTPTGVAVDREAGILYVADNVNRRVDVFQVDGIFLRAFGWDVAPDGSPGDTVGDGLEVCTSVCQPGTGGNGPGQFGVGNGSGHIGALSAIAVDNDITSPAHGDVYVAEAFNHRVQRFHSSGAFVSSFGSAGGGSGEFEAIRGIDVGPGGVIHVVDTKDEGPCELAEVGGGAYAKRIQKFNPSGAVIEQLLPADAPCGEVQGLAVDSTGGFYLANAGTSGAVRKYDPSGAPLATFHSSLGIGALAVDAADSLFVADITEVFSSVYEYDSTGVLFRVFYGDGTLQGRPISLAPFSSAVGDIFAAELLAPGIGALGRVVHIAFPPPGPVVLPDPARTKAEPIGNTKATLNARINPEGKATTFHFEYVDDATYQKDIDELGPGHGFDHAVITPEKAVPAPEKPLVEPLYALGPASAQIGCPEATKALLEEGKCLTPETIYRFRVVASNADGEDTGPEVSFETREPFEILAAWSSEVSADAAQLHAEVNPLSIAAGGHFEYVEEAVYQADVEAGGDGFKEASMSAEVEFGSGEEPVIRSAVLSGLEPGTSYRYRIFVEDVLGFQGEGAVHSFRTFPLAAGLPPCPNDALRDGASVDLPDCRAYEMVTPVEKGGGEIAEGGLTSHDGGGLTQGAAEVPPKGMGFTYSSLRAFGEETISSPFVSQYLASRHPLGDPDEGWTSASVSPPREGAAFNGEFVRDSQYKAFSEDLGLAWLANDSEPSLTEDSIPGFPNLYRRDNRTEGYGAICPASPLGVSSHDLSLELQGFSEAESLAVYRANARLLPNASSKKGIHQTYGCRDGELRLVSVLPPSLGGKANGSHSSVGTRQSTLHEYTEDSLHNAVSADGSRVYWTVPDETVGANIGPGRIYLRENPFAEGGECAGEAAPCTVAVSEAVGGPGASEKASFWTASPDGSVAIFSFSSGALQGNLYEFDAETHTAELIAEEVAGVVGFSEDASRLYLTSAEALASGAMEGEKNLYLYEAGEGGGFTLIAVLPNLNGTDGGACANDSVVPRIRCSRATVDGSRLAFVTNAKLAGYDNTDAASGKLDAEVYIYDSTAKGGEGELRCISCNPSGARPTGAQVLTGTTGWVAAQIPGWNSSFYATRAFSADGRRLFFESFDALVLGDTNGAQDVYQWQEAGSQGECEEKGAELFVPAAGGCISLISSGESSYDSEFLDASADGSDVFFKTFASLVPQDPGLGDVYDARVGGGFRAPHSVLPPCEGEACQGSISPPDDPTPASSSARGAGNVKGSARKRCPKGRRKMRRADKKAFCAKRKRGSHKRGTKR